MIEGATEIDVDELSSEELRDAAWRSGNLGFLLDTHQKETDLLFEEWNARRLTDEYEKIVIEREATLDSVWTDLIGRRFGKTTKWIVKLFEVCIRRQGAVTMYATAFQQDITDIIVPLAEMLSSSAPADMRPEYRRSKMSGKHGLYFPNGSVIKLVGLDKHPNAARGRFSDAIVLSEAGFMRRLENLVRAVLLPQLQRRPWAFLVCESSMSEDPLHDFVRVIIPDCQLREAYCERTIDDNVVISDREKAKEIRQAGGRGHPTCEREFYNVLTRDPEKLVVPEWSDEYVREWVRPKYCVTMTAADPGMQDLFGQIWGYYDFANDKCVIEASWAERNASTCKVACVNAAYEYHLWGTWPHEKMQHIPLRSTKTQQGWIEMLRGLPAEVREHAKRLHEMANTPEDKRVRYGIYPHPDALNYWDGERHRTNPHIRVSDIEVRLIADLLIVYGIEFAKTRKDDRDAQINRFRDAIGGGSYIVLPNSGPFADHVSGAQWNDKRTDWRRDDPKFGHYDCLSAGIYWNRNVDVIKGIRPTPPQYTTTKHDDIAHMPWTQQTPANINGLGELASLGGRSWR